MKANIDPTGNGNYPPAVILSLEMSSLFTCVAIERTLRRLSRQTNDKEMKALYSKTLKDIDWVSDRIGELGNYARYCAGIPQVFGEPGNNAR